MRGIHNEIRDVCTSDCCRVFTQRTVLSESEVRQYWDRLRVKDTITEKQEPERILTLEKHDAKCNVGFRLNAEISCPLCDEDEPQKNISEVLHVIETVAKVRGKR
jgi:hypothetical protein